MWSDDITRTGSIVPEITIAYFSPVQMGVTIYYRGVLKEPRNVHDLISEVSDIARTNTWGVQVVDNAWDESVSLQMVFEDGEPHFEGNAGLKGIVLDVHPDIDGLPLLFDKSGTCRSFVEMAEPARKRHGVSHVSTQYAGIDAHIRLIRFLEYIGDAYMLEWSIEDDSGYAAHRDRAKAQLVFEAVDDAIHAVTEAFSTIDMPEDITGKEEEFLSMVEDRIRTYLPDAEIHRLDEEE